MRAENGSKIMHRVLVPVTTTSGGEAAATGDAQPLLRHGLDIS